MPFRVDARLPQRARTLLSHRKDQVVHDGRANELHDATPPDWYLGRPPYDEGRREWVMYAFDPSERARSGHRSREWNAVAQTEVRVVREMARCLRLIGEGRVPE